MNIFKNLSVKFKLTLSCVSIVVLSVIIFATVIYTRSASVVTRLAERNVEQIMESSFQHINTLIEDINASLLSFQSNESVQSILSSDSSYSKPDDISELEKLLQGIDVFQSKILKSELYVMNRSDFPRLNNTQFVFSDEQMKQDSWYNTMLQSGNSVRWVMRDSQNKNQSHIIASKLIYNVYTQEPMAVLKSTIDMNNFTDYLDNIRLADTGKMFLCSDNHIVHFSDSKLGQRLANNPVVFNDMLKTVSPQTRTTSINGDRWLLKSYALGNTGMFLLGAVKINEFSTAQSSITTALIVTALVLSLFSLVLILFISSLITKPISALSRRMNNYNAEHSNAIHANSHDEIGVLFESFNAMDKTINNLIETINKETEIRKTAEMKALQAQITPHFLYNTLNSISALSKSYGAHDIEQMTMALSRFFMHSLNNGSEMISIHDELEQVKSYVYIQKIRYGDKFKVIINNDPDTDKCLICKLTLQPLVENCIYHAFYDIDYVGIISINVVNDNGVIEITVSDNGIGDVTVDFDKMNEYTNKPFDLDEPIEKYGIHNISQRIKLYFGDEYGLKYYPNPDGGLTVKVTFKAVKKEGEI